MWRTASTSYPASATQYLGGRLLNDNIRGWLLKAAGSTAPAATICSSGSIGA